MFIGGTAERVTQERQTGTQNSHNKSWPSPGHPRRKRYRQKVERGDCPLASRNIIHVAKSKREDESSCCRDNLRSRRKFPIGFHNEAKSQARFDRALCRSVHATIMCSNVETRYRRCLRRARTIEGPREPLLGAPHDIVAFLRNISNPR